MTDAKRMAEIFRGIFGAAVHLQAIVDRDLAADGLTARQAMLLAVITGHKQGPPTIGQAAAIMVTSHQNVMQLARLLVKKGFIMVARDPDDRRVLRLKTTAKNTAYWKAAGSGHGKRIGELFIGFKTSELRAFHRLFNKLAGRIQTFMQAQR